MSNVNWTGPLVLAYSKCFIPTAQGLQVGLNIGDPREGMFFDSSLLCPKNMYSFVDTAISFRNAMDYVSSLRSFPGISWGNLPRFRETPSSSLSVLGSASYPGVELWVSQELQLGGFTYANRTTNAPVKVGKVKLGLPFYGISFSEVEGVRRLCGHLGLSEASSPLEIGLRTFASLGMRDAPDSLNQSRNRDRNSKSWNFSILGMDQTNRWGHGISITGNFSSVDRHFSIGIRFTKRRQRGLKGSELDLWNLARGS